MTDRLPSMPFFVGDYLSSRKVRMMTPAERGVYTHLLFQIWQDGPIQDDERTLVLLADCERSDFRKCWPAVSEMFVKGQDGLLRNEKLEEVRESALRLKQNRSKAGSKGGSKTQAKPKQESTSIPDQTIPLHSVPNQTKEKAEKRSPSSDGKDTPTHRIFRCWNSHDALIHHQNLNPRFRKPINARLKDGYSEADLCKAISEYARLCQIGQAPGHNKWTLAELMSRGQGDWLDKILNGNGAITGAHPNTSKSQTAMEDTQKNMEVFLGNRPPKTRALI